MKTFKEYILLEDKVNYKKYGSWINSKTREVIDVDNFQHKEEMYTWVADQPEGKLKNLPRAAAAAAAAGAQQRPLPSASSAGLIEWAINNGWVRVIHDGNDYSLQGDIKNIKKIWIMVARQFSKQWLSVDLAGSNQPFVSDSFDLTNPKERNEWLRYM